MDLLLIDEMGYLNLRPEQSNLFFKLMEERYNRRSTMLLTNLDYEAWYEFLDARRWSERCWIVCGTAARRSRSRASLCERQSRSGDDGAGGPSNQVSVPPCSRRSRSSLGVARRAREALRALRDRGRSSLDVRCARRLGSPAVDGTEGCPGRGLADLGMGGERSGENEIQQRGQQRARWVGSNW